MLNTYMSQLYSEFLITNGEREIPKYDLFEYKTRYKGTQMKWCSLMYDKPKGGTYFSKLVISLLPPLG